MSDKSPKQHYLNEHAYFLLLRKYIYKTLWILLIWIPDCDSHSPALFIYLFLLMLVLVLQWLLLQLENSDVVVSVSIDFPSNSTGDAPFSCIAYYDCCAD